MGFLHKMVNKYERGDNYELGHSLSSSSVANLFGNGGSSINVQTEYSGYVWDCVNARAEAVANESIYVERQVGDKWQPDYNHKFNQVLEGEDGQYDLYEMLEAHQVCMDMYGESFWYFSKGETYGLPMGRYLLDPAYMTVFVSGDRVTGYKYQKEADYILMDLDEIAHFRIHNPREKYRGLGPMQAAGWFIRSSRYVTTYVNNFLENNAIPAGVIVAKGDVDDADWTLFKQQWAERYSGIDQAGKTGFVRSTDLEFVKTGLSLGDVDFAKIKNSSRDDIMAMFKVSKPILGIYDDINRASAVTARQLFAEIVVDPALKRITRKLTKKVSNWYGTQYRIGSSNPVPDDREVKLTEYDKLLGRAFTVNETRAAYGLEPIPGGDQLQQESRETPVPAKTLGSITIRTKNNAAQFSYEMKENFRSKTEDLQHKYEQDMVQTAHPILKAQEKDVLAQLQPKKLLDANFDVDKEANKLAEATIPLFIGLAKEQGQLAAEFAGNADTVFSLTPHMEKYIADSIRSSALSFTTETQIKIAEILKTGLEAGESIALISNRIKVMYDDVTGVKNPGYRIERLARTEVIKTSNEITEAAYKQSGVVQKKEWLTNPGACEFCRALNGSVIQLGGTYVPVNGKIEGVDGGTRINTYEDIKHPPTHSNCRCTLIPVIERVA